MKLRQKLAVAMASAMVLTSVPVVTMAASTNNMTMGTVLIKEDGAFTSSATAPAVSIEFKNLKDKEVFYLTLENADWADAISAGDYTGVTDMASGTAAAWTKTGVKMLRVSNSTVKVEVESGTLGGTKLELPLLTKNIKGQAKVAIQAMGANTSITEGEFVFATTTDEVATAKVGAPTSFLKEGKIAKITLTEAYKGSMAAGETNYASIDLNDSDFKFDMSKGTIGTAEETSNSNYTKHKLVASYTYGFSGKGLEENNVEYINAYVSKDGSSMYVELPEITDGDSRGNIELKNLHVKSKVKNPAAKELTVNIGEDVEAVKKAVVAVLGSYGAQVEVEEKVEIFAGQTEEVEFEVRENVAGTFTKNRKMSFTIENGYFVNAVLDDEDEVKETETKAELVKVISSIEYQQGGDKEDTFTTEAELKSLITDIEVDEDDRVVGFTITPNVDYSAEDVNGFVVKADINAGLDQSGDITLTVDSRDLEESTTGVIAVAKEAYTLESEVAVLKTGLKGQKVGKITLAETNASLLEKGEKLVICLPDIAGMKFSTAQGDKPEVKVTNGDLQVGAVKVTTAVNSKGKTVPAITVEIKRASQEASSIEISNFHIDTDRTVAEGAYDIEISGKAMTELAGEEITVKDFIKIGTANTEDLVGANGLAKGTSTFVIGQSKYTLNGVEKTMDAQSYIQAPGYTMIPVRYVAEAFGVQGNDILFSKGVVTLFAGNRTIQLTNNSDVAVVNGAQIKMQTKVVVKDGRTYAPVGEIARLLGVSTSWDNTTKTATFTNK